MSEDLIKPQSGAVSVPDKERASRAFALEQEVLSKKEEINSRYFEIGEILSEMKAEGLYLDLGYENIPDWFTSLGISPRLGWFLIEIYDFFIVQQKMKVPTLKEVEISKLFDILSVSRLHPENTEEWVEKAKTLRAVDLRREIKEAKIKERQEKLLTPVINSDVKTELTNNPQDNVVINSDIYPILKNLPNESVDTVICYAGEVGPNGFNYAMIRYMYQALKHRGNFLFFTDSSNFYSVAREMEYWGTKIVRDIIWVKGKNDALVTLDSLVHEHETIVWGSKINFNDKKITPLCNIADYKGDVWSFDIKRKTENKNEKPESLLEELILLTTDPGQLILNPYSGSGEVLAVCKKLGRRFIGIEKDAYWHKVCLERLANTPVS